MYQFSAYWPYYKRNLKVAFPVMLTQFGAAMVGLADSIMVGHYSTTDLAAVNFSNALFFTVMIFATVLGKFTSVIARPLMVILMALFFGAKTLMPLMTDTLSADFSAVGGIIELIAGIIGGALGLLVAIPSYTVIRVIASRFFYHWKQVRRLIPKREQDGSEDEETEMGRS